MSDSAPSRLITPPATLQTLSMPSAAAESVPAPLPVPMSVAISLPVMQDSPGSLPDVNGKNEIQLTWLIATPSPPWNYYRRQLIRRHRPLYSRLPITQRFIIGDIDDVDDAVLVQWENATYGDILHVPGIHEAYNIANAIKPMSFFSYLFNSSIRYDFVLKVDEDTFLHPPTFYDRYTSKLVGVTKVLLVTDIRQFGGEPYFVPKVGFYNLSWDMVGILADLWRRHHYTNFPEDVLVGKLLYDFPDTEHNLIPLLPTEFFEYGVGLCDVSKMDHDVNPGTMAVHGLKEDDAFLRVSALFTEAGIISE